MKRYAWPLTRLFLITTVYTLWIPLLLLYFYNTGDASQKHTTFIVSVWLVGLGLLDKILTILLKKVEENRAKRNHDLFVSEFNKVFTKKEEK